MKTAQEHLRGAELPGGGHYARPPGLRRGWLGLLAGVLGLVFLMLVGLPWLHRVAGLEDSVSIIHEREIEAGAIYYNTVEKVSEAESFLRGAVIPQGEGGSQP